MTLTAYENLRTKADEAWAMVANPPRTLMRVGDATCSRVVGAGATLDRLRQEVQTRGLDADVMITGCLGLCYAEPLVEITRPGGQSVVYSKVTADKVPALVAQSIVGDGIAHEM